MKKYLAVIVALFFALFVYAGCGNSQQDTGSASVNNDVKKTSIPEIKQNEPFAVKTDNGSYTITMEGARTTEDRLDSYGMEVEDVVLLDFSYNNNDYSSDAGDLKIYPEAFQVMDDEGTILNEYPSYDPNRVVREIPMGARCDASIAYGLTKKSDTIHVIFRRPDNQKLGEITLPITN